MHLYQQYIEDILLVKKLGEKYNFRGHLGDQGFYTLLSFEVLCLALFLESPVVCVVEKPWLQRDILLVSQL